MICPKCNKDFIPTIKNNYKTRFCSRSCANSRIFNEQTNKKKSNSSKKYFQSLSESERKKSTEAARKTLKKIIEDRYNLPFEELSIGMKRDKILEEQNYLCRECNIGQEWNKKSLTFHLDHIDGNRTDNSRMNLRMLCPNCHSQTETYGGKNSRKITNDEILAILDECENNHQICIKLGINPSIRSYNRIDQLRP